MTRRPGTPSPPRRPPGGSEAAPPPPWTRRAAEKLAEHGHNELREQARRSAWAMLLGQFTDFMILLLMAAALVSGLIGEPADALAILAIVVLSGIVGFVQERRAEQAVRALKKLAAPKARVVRGGTAQTVPAAELVPGDLVLLEAGTAVPADLRLVAAAARPADAAAADPDPVGQPCHRRPARLSPWRSSPPVRG